MTHPHFTHYENQLLALSQHTPEMPSGHAGTGQTSLSQTRAGALASGHRNDCRGGEPMAVRPRRSALYMPGSNARALEKAKTLAADVVIFDLEDAVAPEAKEAAREQVVAAVASGGYGDRELVIRINGLDTPWGEEDLTKAAAAAPNAILVPKVSTAAQLFEVGQRLTSAPEAIQVWAMIETPLAILNVREIAAAAQ